MLQQRIMSYTAGTWSGGKLINVKSAAVRSRGLVGFCGPVFATNGKPGANHLSI